MSGWSRKSVHLCLIQAKLIFSLLRGDNLVVFYYLSAFEIWTGWLPTGRWFSPGTPVSSTNQTDNHNITEILLKVALNTINQPTNLAWWRSLAFDERGLIKVELLDTIHNSHKTHQYEMYKLGCNKKLWVHNWHIK